MGIACFRVQEEDLGSEGGTSFFDLKANDSSGRRVDFYIYKNRSAFLIVNVSSKGSLAKINFQMLNELHYLYRGSGLEIMAFPCGQFGRSEPQNDGKLIDEIRDKYKPKFSIFQNLQVNGSHVHPVYQYLRRQPLLINDQTGKSKMISGNFAICLLNKEGRLFRYFKPSKDFEELKKSLKRTLFRERQNSKRANITVENK